jgi:hypothetical protein
MQSLQQLKENSQQFGKRNGGKIRRPSGIGVTAESPAISPLQHLKQQGRHYAHPKIKSPNHP